MNDNIRHPFSCTARFPCNAYLALPMHLSRIALAAALAACLTPALAQEQPVPPGEPAQDAIAQVVDVQSTRDPELRSYRTML